MCPLCSALLRCNNKWNTLLSMWLRQHHLGGECAHCARHMHGLPIKIKDALFPVWQTGYTVEGRIIFFYTCPVIHKLHKLHTPHQQNHLYFLTVFINTDLFLVTRKSVVEGNFSSQFLSVKLTPNNKMMMKMKMIFFTCVSIVRRIIQSSILLKCNLYLPSE